MNRFSKQEQEKFYKGLEDINLDSQSDMEDSFYQRQKTRMQTQLAAMRKLKQTHHDAILQQLKNNNRQEDELITQYEQQITELQKITKNQVMNVIDNEIISDIKAKIAQNNNNSVLTLADEQYNLSVLQQSIIQTQIQPENKSFVKKKPVNEGLKKQEQAIRVKMESISRERQLLNMQREDKSSMKYQMECLSHLFRQRFVNPMFPHRPQQDCKIKLVQSSVKNTFTNLVPQSVNDQTVLPKNDPKIAMKQLKMHKKKALKPISTVEVKIKPKKIIQEVDQFEEIADNKKIKQTQKTNLQTIFSQYIDSITPCINKADTINQTYTPRFLGWLEDSQKNINVDYENSENDKNNKQKKLDQVASFEKAGALKQLKITFEGLTHLNGIQKFSNLQQVALQFNAIKLIEPIKSCSKLIQLNLSYNKLRSVSSVSGLPWLRLLNIQHNSIQSLIIQCPSLQIVWAGHNAIEQLSVNQSKYLRILLLNNNKINQLPTLSLYNLQEINLSYNQIRILQNLQALILLKKFNLSHNRIEKLPSKIVYLYLNQLHLSHNYLPSLTCLFLPCLQRLYLNNNRLTGRTNAQIYLPNLKQLNVDQNRLQGFSLVWELLRYSRGLEFLRYSNNEYFLSLRQKIRQIYQSMLFKFMANLKIINQSGQDIGLKKYYQQNYSVYFNQDGFFGQSPASIQLIQNRMKFILQQFRLSSLLQTEKNSFLKQQQYIAYQYLAKISQLKQILSDKNTLYSITNVQPSLFYHHDQHEINKRNLSHMLRGALLQVQYRKKLRLQYFLKNRDKISQSLFFLKMLHQESQIKKAINKFAYLLKGMNQQSAAIKIQKVWRGYVRRKLYLKLIGRSKPKLQDDDSDFQDVDIDFFDQTLEKHQFKIQEIQGLDLQDIIIRPEVFQMLQARLTAENNNKPKPQNDKNEEKGVKGPMVDNFMKNQSQVSNRKSNQITQQQQLMKEWRIKDPRLLKALQYKQNKRLQARRKQQQKNMTAAQRLQRFRRGGK